MIFGAGVTGAGGFGLGTIVLGIGIILAYAIPIGIVGGILYWFFSGAASWFKRVGYPKWQAYIPFYNVYLVFKKKGILYLFWVWLLIMLIGIGIIHNRYVAFYGTLFFGLFIGVIIRGDDIVGFRDIICVGAAPLIISWQVIDLIVYGVW